MNKILIGALTVSLGAGIVMACTGDPGSAGPAGAAGTAGANGTNGSNGANGAAGAKGTTGGNGAAGQNGANGDAGAPGATVIISTRSKHGLDISPVPISTAGLTQDQVEQLGQGSYLVNAVADCAGCHNSPDATPKFLGGGTAFPTDATHSVTSRNLTPDSATGLKLTEAQFIEVLRTGKDFTNSPDGGTAVALQVMPWETFRWMSTADLKAIYAYLRAIPAQTNTIPADNKVASAPVSFTGQYFDGTVARPLPPETDFQGNPIPDPDNVLRGLAINPLADGSGSLTTAGAQGAYGRGSYIVNAVADCTGCHTNPARASGKVDSAQFLAGGAVFPTPPPLQPLLKTTRVMSANLTGKTQGFFNTGGASFPVFLAAITQGVHADDPPPQMPLGFPMPARVFRNMDLTDLEAVHTYVRNVAAQNVLGDKAIRRTAMYCTAATDCDQANNETCTTNECVNRTCATSADCPVCQTCTGGSNNRCALPAAGPLAGCIGAGI